MKDKIKLVAAIFAAAALALAAMAHLAAGIWFLVSFAMRCGT